MLQVASTNSPTGSLTADPARWAEESSSVRSAAEFYPDSRVAGPASAERWDGVLVAQPALAGRRLAELLNSAQQLR